MPSNMKRTALIVIGAALAINIFIYHATVYHAKYGTKLGPFSDSDSIVQPILYTAEKNGPNTYTAGTPFESQVMHYLEVDGCPCQDILRAGVVLRMIPTSEFLLNTLIWTVPLGLAAFFVRKKTP